MIIVAAAPDNICRKCSQKQLVLTGAIVQQAVHRCGCGPEATSTPIVVSADAIIENRKAYSGGMTIQQETDEETDLYTELLQLDDLRKKGILTDEEFEKQKKKLLEEN